MLASSVSLEHYNDSCCRSSNRHVDWLVVHTVMGTGLSVSQPYVSIAFESAPCRSTAFIKIHRLLVPVYLVDALHMRFQVVQPNPAADRLPAPGTNTSCLRIRCLHMLSCPNMSIDIECLEKLACPSTCVTKPLQCTLPPISRHSTVT